jgi:hypothetical protein
MVGTACLVAQKGALAVATTFGWPKVTTRVDAQTCVLSTQP